jgi:hypothetical protein
MDYTTDNNPRALHRATLNGLEFPKYASEGAWPSAEDVQSLADTAFADRKNRLHPLHTKAAAFVSAVYCANLDAQPAPEIIENLKQAAMAHGIEADVLPILAEINNKQAAESSAPDTYALRDGKEHAFYPVGTNHDIEHSSIGILRDMRNKHLPVKCARQACLNLVRRADQLKYAQSLLPDEILLLGRDTVARVDALEKQADWRERQTGTNLYKEAVDMFRSNPTEENRQAGAEAWEQLDEACGIKQSSLTPSVASCWFAGTDLVAVKAAARHMVWLGDESVPSGVFSTVPPEVYQSWYGAHEQEKIAAVFEAAARDGLEASELLDAMTGDERAVLAGHLQRHHRP